MLEIKLGIIGAGAMGLLFAGKCSRAVGQVNLITRSTEQKDRLKSSSLVVTDLSGALTSARFNYLSYNERNDEAFSEQHKSLQLDWLLVFVKQEHMDDSFIHYLSNYVEQGTRLVFFQNGIGHMERVMAAFPAEQLFVAVTTEAALKQSPCAIKHTGSGETWIGQWHGPIQSDDDTVALMNLLVRAGFVVHLSKNIKTVVWNKLLINAIINPLTAILNMNNGELLTSSYLSQLMKLLYEEGRAVAANERVDLSDHLWEELIAVCQATASNTSSMLSDRLAGKRTEIEWINGALIRLAEQSGISVPTHKAVYLMLKGIEPIS